MDEFNLSLAIATGLIGDFNRFNFTNKEITEYLSDNFPAVEGSEPVNFKKVQGILWRMREQNRDGNRELLTEGEKIFHQLEDLEEKSRSIDFSSDAEHSPGSRYEKDYAEIDKDPSDIQKSEKDELVKDVIDSYIQEDKELGQQNLFED